MIRETIEIVLEVTSAMGDRLRTMWFAKRRRVLLCALAFMPVSVVVATTLVSSVLLIGPGGRVTNWYLQNATLAIMNREYEKARLCYAGLLQRDPDNQQYQFGLALSLFGLGENAAAITLTTRLAPAGEGGYAPAHVFVAEQLITRDKATEEDLARSEQHLLNALKVDAANSRANALLAALYVRTERWDEFQRHLELVGEAVDEIGLTIAEQLAARGQPVEAESWVKRAVQFHRNRCTANPNDLASRLKWAQGLVMLRDFESAIELLETAMRQSDDPALRQVTAQAYRAWSLAAALTPARRMVVLHRALAMDPANKALLLQLADPQVAESAVHARSATQPSEGAAIQSICRAVAASRKGDTKGAVNELTSAILIGDVGTPEMIANLACVWGYSSQADALSALTLAAALLDVLPDSPLAQRAVGLVLARHGRWNRASLYLDSALRAMPNDLLMRAQLATCFEQMGMPEEAAAQRAVVAAATRPATRPTTLPAIRPVAR